MQSLDLLRQNLINSRDRTLAKVEDMREHAVVFPTPHGGGHTLWVLGHLAFTEMQILHQFVLGEENPLAEWEEVFDQPDGVEVVDDAAAFPPFDQVLDRCRAARQETLDLLDTLSEEDLDQTSGFVPKGWDHTFGTYRRSLQFLADHWYMHRGQLADARRAAGLHRMWV